MAQIEIKDLTFTYAASNVPAIKKINLQIEKGDFVVICGKSGCGKSTIMRMLKPAISPEGEISGSIKINSMDINEMSQRDQTEKIGFVMQNPEHQIVTDKVWHEMAFGLENLGYSKDNIRLRVAEMSEYFGISHWYEKKVDDLSGGQKQLLNLAAVLAMHPDILVLDEPTSALDPIAAENFVNTLKKINDDLGITIIISEHRLNELIPVADKVVVMKEGKIYIHDTAEAVAEKISSDEEFKFMPIPSRIYKEVTDNAIDDNKLREMPLTVGQGRKWIEKSLKADYKKPDIIDSLRTKKNGISDIKKNGSKPTVNVKNVWFRYEKNLEDIVKDLKFSVNSGEIFCILGGNGAGKSTMLSMIAGIRKPYRGKINTLGTIAMLPQNVQSLFCMDSVGEELKQSKKAYINDIIREMKLKKYSNTHPYDLSGGEQQKLGLAKVLASDSDIILLDELTKGIDNIYKEEIGNVLLELKKMGKTIIMVSHDIEFCAQFGDRCGLFFNGNITAVNKTKKFFGTNRFYTTATHKMFSGICNDVITKEDAVCFMEANSTTQQDL